MYAKHKSLLLGALVAIFLSLFAVNLHALGTPSGTEVINGDDRPIKNVLDQAGDVIVTWHGGLTKSSETSNAVTLIVDPGYGMTWVSLPVPTTQNLPPGATAFYAYAIRNIGNIGDKFRFDATTVTTNAGNIDHWRLRFHVDTPPLGVFNGETFLTFPQTRDVGMEATSYILLSVYIPHDTVNGSSATVRLTVKNQNGAGTNDFWPTATNDDTFTHDTLTMYNEALLTVFKSTHSIDGRERPFDRFEYVLTVNNPTALPATNVVLRDKLPAFVTFVKNAYDGEGGGTELGIKRDSPAPVTYYTSAVDGDAAEYDDATGAVVIRIGTIAPGASVTYRFRVQVK